MGAALAPFHKEGSPQNKGGDSAQPVSTPTGKRPLVKGAILFVFSFFIPRIIKKMKGE
jgi:hypothetical protein